MSTHSFAFRHIGPRERDIEQMLKRIGARSLEELMDQTIPANIRLKKPLKIEKGMSEHEYLRQLKKIAQKNKVFRSYIGLGYSNCVVPPVIQRNVLENPGWYTAYTPYQAEIAQGRLEALLNYQTLVIDLTGLPIANASLLDEATAAAEAMIMFYNSRTKEQEKDNANLFFVSDKCYPQTIDVLRTRSAPLGIDLVTGDAASFRFSEKVFGALLQYPDVNGEVKNYSAFVKNAHTVNAHVAVAADLLSLALLVPPGEWDADCVVGNSQRFGVPLGYGGPHAAFFACKDSFKRIIPGRIIGLSIDSNGNHALRMALQTREQHIRREKATSNICTAQALLAIMASMYGVYHGPEGLKEIAGKVHRSACALADELKKLGFVSQNKVFFDTLTLSLPEGISIQKIKEVAEVSEINFRYSEDRIHISLDEAASAEDLQSILNVFANVMRTPASNLAQADLSKTKPAITKEFSRASSFMTHPVFNTFHSETEMMRYIKRLENKDLSLTHSMISLGSCTMKLNAVAELYPITWNAFANMHPFAPSEQAQGYHEMIAELEKMLCEITGFAAVSFQPNSGAQGEYAGLMVIRAYHKSRNQENRNVVLIPSSAHGTNPASAAMAGMRIVVVKCDENGNIDIADLKQKAEANKDNLSCLMVTYPSTHGVFEEGITEITKIVHDNGGQVYMDGANMNAQVGLTSPGSIGADVCHLNLHKTFAIPHGGGGPGMGPIGVAKHLAPFLPSHAIIRTGGEKGIPAVSAAPFGSSLILLISYGYCKMLGGDGMTESTRVAILNANYLKELLKDHYPILYVGKNNRVAHEMILDCKDFKRTSGVEVTDIAKRLMDYGFHAPTVAFPVHDTLMVEPTESESREELDRFAEAMITIRKEIGEIENGKADPRDNVLKNSPHTAAVVTADDWKHAYAREKAAYPLNYLRSNKFWCAVGRVDNAYGDRNLICACPPVENYTEELVL